ncbi:MAG: 4Fe-4S binding protein [Candidatus Nanohaloarchaea archaeon]
MTEKIAVYMCESKGHISDTVDLEEVKKHVEEMENVEYVKTHELLCGSDGQEMIGDDIENNDLDKIVIGGGSPKEKRKGYEDVMEEKGMNPFRLHMVNLREQCSWVTEDEGNATSKAKALMSAGVKRAEKMEPIDIQEIEYDTDVLIFGGSLGAIDAARSLSRADRKVYLVTDRESVGGFTVQQEFLYPEDQCAPCAVAPKTEEMDHDDNIEIIAPGQVEEVLGSPGNFEVKFKEEARFVDPEKCMPCDKCAQACPVSVDNEFDKGMSQRSAIYKLFPGAVPNAYMIDTENCLRFQGETKEELGDDYPVEDCTKCMEACPLDAVDYEDETVEREITVGSIIISPKADTYDADNVYPDIRERDIDVYTNMEAERFFSEAGPTGGEVEMKNGEEPDSVAILHCVGSRCEEHLPYCSGTCCMDGLKIARGMKEELDDVEVYNVHEDLVTPGQGFDDYVREAQDRGVNLLKWKLEDGKIADLEERGEQIAVTGENHQGEERELEVDMVVLMTGWTPPENIDMIKDVFGLHSDEYGFLEVQKPVESPTEAAEGKYVSGKVQGPTDAFGSLTEGLEATGDILSKVVPGRKFKLEPQHAVVDEDTCIGCRICVETCPYNAISRNDEKGVAEVDETLCKGCGACVGACPARAIEQQNFTNDQLTAEMEGLLQ